MGSLLDYLPFSRRKPVAEPTLRQHFVPMRVQRLIKRGRVKLIDNREGKNIALPRCICAVRTKRASRKSHQVLPLY